MKISQIIIGLLCFVILFSLARAITVLPFKITLIVIIGFIFAVITLINLEIGLYAFIFVIPFTQQFLVGRMGGSGRGAPVDIGTDDILMIFLIFSWLANLARRKESPFLKTNLNWPIMAYFVIAIFSFIGAESRFGQGTVLVGFLHLMKFYEYVLIYFIVVSTIKNLEQIKRFLTMFFIVVGFIAVIHFAAMLRYGHFSLGAALPSPQQVMLFTHTIHAFVSNATLGTYYAFFLSILLAMILGMSRNENRIPLALFILMVSFAMFNTYARSVYVGMFISCLILALLKEKRMVLIVLLLGVFSPIYMQSAVFERITLTIQTIKPTIVLDASAAIRLVLWKQGLKVFLSTPFLGTGFWTTRFMLGGEVHSQYVAILVETGVIGFSVFLWMIITMFKNGAALMKRANTVFLHSLGAGYIAGLAAIMVTCFFSETFEAHRMTGPLWFVTGLIVSANRLLSEEKTEELDTDST